jgi:uracil DNA glycosylase
MEEVVVVVVVMVAKRVGSLFRTALHMNLMKLHPLSVAAAEESFFVSRSLSRTHHLKHHTHTKNTPFYQ